MLLIQIGVAYTKNILILYIGFFLFFIKSLLYNYLRLTIFLNQPFIKILIREKL